MTWWSSLRRALSSSPQPAVADNEAAAVASYLIRLQPYLGQVERVLMEEWPAALGTGDLDEVQATVERTMPVLVRARDFLAIEAPPPMFGVAAPRMRGAIDGYIARTGCQWRYLPACYPPWEAVWQQWRRWRASGVWATAMERIAEMIRTRHGRTATPSMVMIDGQTVRGGRAGPTFHEKGGRGGRTNGAKRSVVIDILGLPLAVSVESARPHDVSADRRLLDATLPALGTVKAGVADRGYRGLGKMTAKKGIRLDIKAPPKGTAGFTPIAPLYRVEHAFARLGRWRRLSRCYEGSAESARARLEVAALGYLFARSRAEPA